MGLFCKSSNKVKSILFVINLFLIILSAPMPFAVSYIMPYSVIALECIPFCHVLFFSLFVVMNEEQFSSESAQLFFVIFLILILLTLCCAILGHFVNRRFSWIVYLFVTVDLFVKLVRLNIIGFLWGLAIIILTAITRKEYKWYEEDNT